MAPRHIELHRTDRIGWLRAAVLGANDGIVSTASLVLGVASAQGTHSAVMVAGIAGLVAGAMSMAAGEYVSVRSQADSEGAALETERRELAADDAAERRELARAVTRVYVKVGLIMTTRLGIGGAFQARYAGAAMGLYGPNEAAGWIASVVGAIVLLVIYGLVKGGTRRV
jgi:VIT1/CCC1 family predicted Fe2+/Mn2+ transporter